MTAKNNQNERIETIEIPFFDENTGKWSTKIVEKGKHPVTLDESGNSMFEEAKEP